MADVSIGDRVIAADAVTGQLRYSSVYMIPHKEPSTLSTYVNVQVEESILRLSPRHFIPVCVSQPCTVSSHWENRYARDLLAGDVVRTVTGLSAVHAVSLSVEKGSFNPFVIGGTIIVDGVLASDQSDWILDDLVSESLIKYIPSIYNAITAPARWAFWALGPARWAALDDMLGVSFIGHNYGRIVIFRFVPFAVAAMLLGVKTALNAVVNTKKN